MYFAIIVIISIVCVVVIILADIGGGADGLGSMCPSSGLG